VLQKDISEKAGLPEQKLPKIKHFSAHYSQEDYIMTTVVKKGFDHRNNEIKL